MSNDFLPEKDKELIAWASQFVMSATANITATQLTDTQLTAFHTTTQAAQAAINEAEAKRSAAQAATVIKKDKIALLTTSARELNRILQSNQNVTVETKRTLGLKVRPVKRKPIALVVPIELQVVGSPNQQNVLTWDAGGNHDNTLYEVEASFGEGEPFFVVTFLIGTRYVHSGVKPGQEMVYRVRAKRRTVYSGYSNLATVYPKAAPVLRLPAVRTVNLKKAA